MNLASILAALKSLPKVELGKYSQFLALAIPLLPEKVKIKGRLVNLRATVANAVSDGDLDADDALAFVVAYVSGEPVSLPPSVKPVPVPPPTDPVPAPAGRLWPTSLAIEVHSLSMRGEDIPFAIDNLGEYLQMRRIDGTESITGHTKLYLGARYIDSLGHDINFEERGTPYLYNTAEWDVISENGRGGDKLWSITPGMPAGEGTVTKTENGVANFPLGEATRTGLMDIVVNIPEPPSSAARPQGLRVRLAVLTPTGRAGAIDLRLPPLR